MLHGRWIELYAPCLKSKLGAVINECQTDFKIKHMLFCQSNVFSCFWIYGSKEYIGHKRQIGTSNRSINQLPGMPIFFTVGAALNKEHKRPDRETCPHSHQFLKQSINGFFFSIITLKRSKNKTKLQFTHGNKIFLQCFHAQVDVIKGAGVNSN